MHNNYYFLKRLTPRLTDKISGVTVAECYTQNKNELIMVFGNGFIIKAYLDPAFCCLSFPENFHRARRNSVDLFQELVGKSTKQITQFDNERCFSIDFEMEYRLLFKMHGNRSNIILFHQGSVLRLFKNNLKNDSQLSLDKLHRPIDQSLEKLNQYDGDYLELFPTFGPILKKYLNQRDFSNNTLDHQHLLLESMLKSLANGSIFLTKVSGTAHLSLIEFGDVFERFEDPIEAINSLFSYKIQRESLDKEKERHLKGLVTQISRTKNYITSNQKKLVNITDNIDYKQIADILMANLHQIPKQINSVQLENFYSQNELIAIKLSKDLSPQKNAENYYRKSKNQSKEIAVLKENIERKKTLLEELTSQYEYASSLSTLKELRSLIKKNSSVGQKEAPKPFSVRTFMGYTILIGKNARSNDSMLRSAANKNDLWLHAKDVSGSHVIIKEIAGSTFPKPVIEKAAEIAAYHSKKRTETTCPVIYTPRKYVRKRKGDPPGAVMVEKEEVILVQPKDSN